MSSPASNAASLDATSSPPPGAASADKALAIDVTGLTRRFGDLEVLKGIDLKIGVGECVGLLGPNGAGKTTTVEILEGLQQPTAGEVKILGRTWKEAPQEIRERIGVQLQETRFPERLTAEEVVELFGSFQSRSLTVDQAISLVKLEEKRKARVQHLSGGQLQRLALAVALVGNPELIFLDEPTTGLDPQSRRVLWDVIEELKREGRTIVITTHYLEEAERLCNRVVIVDHGKVIAQGTPAELISRLKGSQVIEVATTPPLEPALLEGLPGFVSSHRQAGGSSLSVTELHVALPALIALLESSNIQLQNLSTRKATLEDVFLELTGRTLRDSGTSSDA